MIRFSAMRKAGVALATLPFIVAAAAETLRFKDQAGLDIILDKPVERVVTIPIPSASTFIAVDGSPKRLVGMHPLSKSAIEESILGRIFPDANAIDSSVTGSGSLGFAPNIEALATLNPDVVVQWGDRGDDIIAPMTNIGLKVARILYGKEEHARGNLRVMGDIAGKPEKVEHLIGWRDEVMQDIKTKVASIPEPRRLKVIYLLRALGELQVAGANTYYDYYFRLVGAENPAAPALNDFKSVNAEQIAAWDPDAILLNGFERKLGPERIYDDPILSSTSAARERRVYKMPMGGYRWDPPSQESPLTWMWLAELLYPDTFRYDLRREIRRRYQEIYDYAPSEADINDILRMTMNGGARHYERFATNR
jgi:iron complex transport system substrate-binding protein